MTKLTVLSFSRAKKKSRPMLVSTQVDSNDKFASQFAVQDDFGARNHGWFAVFADDFSQPRLKRLRLVSRWAPVQSELAVADCGTLGASSQSKGCLGPRVTRRHSKVHSRQVLCQQQILSTG